VGGLDSPLKLAPQQFNALSSWMAHAECMDELTSRNSPPGGEFVAPATTTDGLGGKADHASAETDYMIGFHWVE